jgi:response regulator RpfG family c-di-GMP phosphodiesterase
MPCSLLVSGTAQNAPEVMMTSVKNTVPMAAIATMVISRNTLKDFGYAILEAEDGESAVRKFVENKDTVRLLLFDVIMPRQDGKEAYHAIKRMAPGIKVLFISGHNTNMLSQKGITEEGLELILKPVSPEALLKKVREVLDK